MTVCRTKRWGSSLGIVIPKALVQEWNLSENQQVDIQIQSVENPLKELFGFAKRKGMKKSTEQILKETRAVLGAD
jgi:antitoxin component of MazEF toxin-antitoxin module